MPACTHQTISTWPTASRECMRQATPQPQRLLGTYHMGEALSLLAMGEVFKLSGPILAPVRHRLVARPHRSIYSDCW